MLMVVSALALSWRAQVRDLRNRESPNLGTGGCGEPVDPAFGRGRCLKLVEQASKPQGFGFPTPACAIFSSSFLSCG